MQKEGRCLYAKFITYAIYVQVSYSIYDPISQKIIYYKLIEDIQEIIKELYKWEGVEIIEGHMMADHIHLLLSIPTKSEKYGETKCRGRSIQNYLCYPRTAEKPVIFAACNFGGNFNVYCRRSTLYITVGKGFSLKLS